MGTTRSVRTAILPLTVAVSSSLAFSQEVGIISNTKDFLEGGCTLSLPAEPANSRKYVFLSDWDENAVIHVDGRDVRLTLVRSQEKKGEPKKGDRSHKWYAGDEVSVRVEFVVRELCPEGEGFESCEVIYYDAVLHVRKGGTAKAVHAKGLCGS